MSKLTWPAWFNSPDGTQSQIFNDESEVPRGWTSGAEKITVAALQEPAAKPAAPAAAPLADTKDAHGHVFDPKLHTGTMTSKGLWRMKVGVPRPAPIAPLQHDL